jgi:two-component system phosphate regulon sensor histidine kinase PhoR
VDPDRDELWRLVQEHSPVGMALVDLQGRPIMVNRALCQFLGQDAEQLREKGFPEFTHPDDVQADVELFDKVVAGELDSYRLRKRYLHSDGHIVWGDLSVAVMRDANGVPEQLISQVVDVTELEHERRTLEAIFNTVDVGLLLIDEEGQYSRMNRRHAESMLMPFPDGHAGMAGQLGDVFFPDGTPMPREEMPSYRAWHGEEFDDLRLWVGKDPGGRSAWSVSARSVREPDGEFTGAALAYKNITDLMRALQVKDDFVASVSHELRTPLTAVLGHLEILCDSPDLPPAIARQLQVVQRNAARLHTLVTDLLDVARVREGSMTLQQDPVDLAVLVAEAVAVAQPVADTAGVSLELEAPGSLVIHGDGHRLRQVTDNLITNALKYTEPGGAVSVQLLGGDGVELAVTDTGMGIAEADVEQVFDRFYRSSEVEARHIPGTGLGLSIVRDIVEAHSGSIAVTSRVGEGSTFTVHLPEGGTAQ